MISPPEASWRAMTDPIPPVPMIAMVMTETSGCRRLRAHRRVPALLSVRMATGNSRARANPVRVGGVTRKIDV
jgi:hypothetical protein